MAKKKIKDIIEEISADFMTDNGLELYNVEFLKEGKDWFLRIYIDKAIQAEQEDCDEDSYVSTDDCELVSRFLSDELDRLDPIEQNYYLEVSSPGMDRQLFEQKHYDRFAGHLVEVKLYKGVDGKKVFEGILVGLIDGNVIIKVEDKEQKFPLQQVAKTSLAVVF
ncbi:MAG: ribosome maturation factor RimP [Emergencia sp.]|nr:ribosome maturation factor RimP [Emergencia sp.]